MLVNNVVDTGGITFAYRVTEDAGVGYVDAVRAFAASEAIFGIGTTWRRIRAAGDAGVPVAVTDRMTLDLRRLPDRSARWLLNYRPQPLAVGAEINQPVRGQGGRPVAGMPRWLRGDDQAIVAARVRRVRRRGRPRTSPATVASGLYQYSLLDVIDIADIAERDPAEVADTYFALMGTSGRTVC